METKQQATTRTFKARLKDLLEKAGITVMDGYEVTGVTESTHQKRPCMVVDREGKRRCFFIDKESPLVEVNEDGSATVKNIHDENILFQFLMQRPLAPTDVGLPAFAELQPVEAARQAPAGLGVVREMGVR